MDVIAVYDEKNYNPDWKRCVRKAVRAVILRGDKIALIKCQKEGFYKFPGGGIEEGETRLETLIRETGEEAGLRIKPDSVREFGVMREVRAGLFGEEIFDQTSYYYLADVEDQIMEQDLDKYEEEMGYELVWIRIREAYETNMKIGEEKQYKTTFLLRESHVLKCLLDMEKTAFGLSSKRGGT